VWDEGVQDGDVRVVEVEEDLRPGEILAPPPLVLRTALQGVSHMVGAVPGLGK
jgi:hypothetical protein